MFYLEVSQIYLQDNSDVSDSIALISLVLRDTNRGR